jgi:hypothetical protein
VRTDADGAGDRLRQGIEPLHERRVGTASTMKWQGRVLAPRSCRDSGMQLRLQDRMIVRRITADKEKIVAPAPV